MPFANSGFWPESAKTGRRGGAAELVRRQQRLCRPPFAFFFVRYGVASEHGGGRLPNILQTGPVRYFIDAEFNGFGGDLVAIAALPERDEVAPFYEAVECPSPVPWVTAHVLPFLHTKPKPLAEVAQLFSGYLASDSDPVLIADWPDDIGLAVSLLTNGRGGRLFPGAVRFELLETSDFASERHSKVPHNAYYDAVALRNWAKSVEQG